MKPETLDVDIMSFPSEFVADVLLINMKRLPLRLNEEEADFDRNANKYHVDTLFSTPNDRNRRTSEDAEVRRIKSGFDSHDGPVAEGAVPESESPTEAAAVNKDVAWAFGGFGESARSLKGKHKKKHGKRVGLSM